MGKIGIFFGSDTGNTEKIARIIQKKLGMQISDIYDIAKSSKENFFNYEKLLLGIPTWYYGEAQCDWDDFLPTIQEIDFTNKCVALFGCGDQEDYSEYFCDAMGILRDIVIRKGANLVGKWSTSGYFFEKSKSLIDKNYFIGLTIDEDRQKELTNKRINLWTEQVIDELYATK